TGPSTTTGIRCAPSTTKAPSSSNTSRDFKWRSEGWWTTGKPPTRHAPSLRTRTPSGTGQKSVTGASIASGVLGGVAGESEPAVGTLGGVLGEDRLAGGAVRVVERDVRHGIRSVQG